MLLEILLGEDSLDVLVKVVVSDLDWIRWVSVEVFEVLVLLFGQLNLLGVEGSSEFGGLDGSLSEWIVVLKELSKSDSVPHNGVLDLLQESIDVLGSSEINV